MRNLPVAGLFLAALVFPGCGPVVIGAAASSGGGGGGGPNLAVALLIAPGNNTAVSEPQQTFSYTAPDAERYQWRIDDGDWKETASTTVTQTLAEGPRTFEVRALQGDLVGPERQVAFRVDSIPPSAVMLDRPMRSGVGAVRLEWELLPDSGTERTFTVEVEGQDPVTVTAAQAVGDRMIVEVTGLPQCAQLFGRVDTVDEAGNATSGVPVTFQSSCGADGRFREISPVEFGVTDFRAIAQGDYDADGQRDLLVAGEIPPTSTGNTGRLYVLQNQGDLGARGFARLPGAGVYDRPDPIVAVVPMDLDRDGVEDIVIAWGSTLQVLRGNGDRQNPNTNASFSPLTTQSLGAPVRELRAIQIDGDAVPDLVIVTGSASAQQVLYALGDESSSSFAIQNAASPISVGVADALVVDLDRDGHEDLVVTSTSGGTSAMFGSGAVLMPPVSLGGGGIRIAAVDFDGDGDQDLAVARPEQLVPLANTGTQFLQGPQVAVPAAAEQLLVADFNGDRIDDVLGVAAGSVFLLEGLADLSAGPFGTAVNPLRGTPTLAGLGRAVALDVDGDSMQDLAVLDSSALQLRVFGGTGVVFRGDGTFGAAAAISTMEATNPFTVEIADLNGDRVPDIGVTNKLKFVQLLNQGSRGQPDGRFVDGVVESGLLDSQSLYVSDLNGDGRNDVVTADFQPQQSAPSRLNVLVQESDGSYFRTFVTIPDRPRDVLLRDYDGDGRLDVAIAHFTPPILTIIRNNGSSMQPFVAADRVSINVQNPGLSNPSLFQLAAGDFDDDGDLDIVATDINDGSYGVFENLGGAFQQPQDWIATSATIAANLRRPSYIIARDFTGDGVLDLLVANGKQFFGGAFDGEVVVLPGNTDPAGRPDGTFAAASPALTLSIPPSVSDRPWVVAAADLNHDRILDLGIVSEGSDTTVAVALGLGENGRGNGTFGALSTFASSIAGRRYDVEFFDLDGDGALDMVASGNIDGSPGNGVVDLFRGNGERLERQ